MMRYATHSRLRVARRMVGLPVGVGIAAAVALTACSGAGSAHRAASPPARSAHATSSAATSSPVRAGAGGPTAPAAADPAGTQPIRIRIPSIDVDSGLQSLHITSSKELQTPSQWQRAGWYADGVRPGDTGPAVIAGHIDSVNGPAVFARLTDLKTGAIVLITRADHAVLRFVVDRNQRYPKKHFPTEAVYGPSSLPLLRLITCTGKFDEHARSYLDNLVVTTHLEGS
ncbi:class F sortase [uncultured Jatrophihabitans sp.]|uniref:class F sortase n=1 Tax=uncultured Jatrophihabitans sp. TaxID=1610747 RepID=UPI0035CBBEE9